MSIKGVLKPFSALKQIARKPHTVIYPYSKKITAEGYRGFHYNDVETCIGCGNCAHICQNLAIDMVKVEGISEKPGDSGFRPVVDYGRCCWCGLCVEVCPTGSLKLTREYINVSTDVKDYIYTPGIEHKEYADTGIGFASDFETTTLLKLDRVPMRELDPEERKYSFAEVVLGYMASEAKKEAERCMGCGICISNCPVHMHIPDYIRAIAEDDLATSINIMYDNNPLSETCGKVCTRRCESVCVLTHHGEPVAIRWLKRYVTEQFPKFEDVLKHKPLPKNGKKVGIIGAGPSGLTAGYYLSLLGYDVTIYEANPVAGGMIFAGIPKYRLPLDSIQKQVSYLESKGVKIVYNTKVGRDISFDEIYKKYDAIFMGIGFQKGYKLKIKGEDLPGVRPAVEFLADVNLGRKVSPGEKVVVVGGGNVAIDAARISFRVGVKEVYLSYRRREQDMPADYEEIEAAKEEGVKFYTQTIPIRIEKTPDGKRLRYFYYKARMESQGEGKRPRPVPITDKEYFFEVDSVFVAIGQTSDLSFLPESLKNKLEIEWGRIPVFEYNQTKDPKIFAGGDTSNRNADVVSAVADGLKAAKGIHLFLTGKMKE